VYTIISGASRISCRSYFVEVEEKKKKKKILKTWGPPLYLTKYGSVLLPIKKQKKKN